MKISLITVCYNSAETIEKTIVSVASQTYENIEYIIIDGNSKDNTLEIIQKYNNQISKWISEPDKGLYDAMNKGVNLATGDLIGILNSDDTFDSDSVIEKIANFHKENNIDASVGNIIQHRADGKIVRVYTSKYWNSEKLRIGFMPPHPSIFFKRELFNEYGGYNLGFKIGADYELITRFFLKNKIVWKYSGITTTAMLVGGLSSSGASSYKLITKEIQKALSMNGIDFSPLKIKMRFLWKIIGFLRK
ncbi:glycosyltransferase family 2 protein [Flavobacterium hibernum]|uniref:Glycosyl transferase n=1 Tax=Flavobacterium hibernum TaxID=37752 RepID=A0A0D0F3I1_9FLAO|nr:glycosyltransferase family 2 protein [Flavobacterium hibernum]KIO54186.1 glycosyl transferase [Flavobacterium hibernum]OXA89709.1 glycosyl transferase [Flavobacterium hibernum]STO13892.1 PGL/p-HBAD biosynthesis glycosyltransferase Rv2957/MT3031 [Flavobacterium hibernum]